MLLQWLQVFLLLARPELIGYVLHSPPTFCTIQTGLRDFPGGGMIIFDFIVKMFTGNNGWKLLGSFIVSTVRGREFRILSTSAISMRRDSSSRLFPCIFNIDPRIAQEFASPKPQPYDLQMEGLCVILSKQ